MAEQTYGDSFITRRQASHVLHKQDRKVCSRAKGSEADDTAVELMESFLDRLFEGRERVSVAELLHAAYIYSVTQPDEPA